MIASPERTARRVSWIHLASRRLMDDQSIFKHISNLVAEEHQIFAHEAATGGDVEHHERLHEINETLDQRWDYIRRRRAARIQGIDPNTVEPRDRALVERYLQ